MSNESSHKEDIEIPTTKEVDNELDQELKRDEMLTREFEREEMESVD